MADEFTFTAATIAYEPTSSQIRAREIMGQNVLGIELAGWNMFGIEEAIKHFGVSPSRQQLAILADVPFTDATLEACKKTHILVAMFPLSIIEICGKTNSGLFHEPSWYNRESFANDRGDVSWQLVLKTPVRNSTNKTWDAQQALISQDDETPTARVVVYTIIGHYLATSGGPSSPLAKGEQLFPSIQVRCVDLASYGSRVIVGPFDYSDGLHIPNYWFDNTYGDRIGLSSALKSK